MPTALSTAEGPPAVRGRVSDGHRRWRKAKSGFAAALSFVSALIVIAPLGLVFGYLLVKGAGSLNWDFFTKLPAQPATDYSAMFADPPPDRRGCRGRGPRGRSAAGGRPQRHRQLHRRHVRVDRARRGVRRARRRARRIVPERIRAPAGRHGRAFRRGHPQRRAVHRVGHRGLRVVHPAGQGDHPPRLFGAGGGASRSGSL